MKPLTIEIHGTGTHNRGAELMAIAIAERMRAAFKDVRLVVGSKFGDFSARGRHDFLTTWDVDGGYRAKAVFTVLRFGGEWARSVLGVIDPAEVDVVLDASGFAFSDQWGPGAARHLWHKMNRPERRRQRLILLPQALGAFENPEVLAASRQLFGRAEFVCARDAHSFEAAERVGGARRLLQFPDFTLGVRSLRHDGFPVPERFAAIVPNYRMLDKTGSADAYIAFLKESISGLRQHGMNPVFVLHDAKEDRRVIQRFDDIPVLTHSDPRVLKGLLGRAELVIGSRFHALVSSLSQGVPCLGVGWSHKYPELFRDFEVEDLLLADLEDLGALNERIAELADPAKSAARRSRIEAAAIQLKGKTECMWSEVEKVIVACRQ